MTEYTWSYDSFSGCYIIGIESETSNVDTEFPYYLAVEPDVASMIMQGIVEGRIDPPRIKAEWYTKKIIETA